MESAGAELSAGSWHFCTNQDQICRIIEVQSLWNKQYCRVWLPDSDAVVRVPADTLKPIEESLQISPQRMTYIAAAARVADALAKDVLVAPIETSLIPLPHQIQALAHAVSKHRVRFLLADEVGLGKTIEAGLIIRELKLRDLVKRILIVVPKGLVNQWEAEMQTHFGEEFRVMLPSEFDAYRKIFDVEDIWRAYDQVICSVDAVKPVESRRGWSAERVEKYNRERFENLVDAGWDMVVVDEAHRLGGSTSQVARYKLGQGLAEASPYLLLLSATPHQGKSDSFRRLLSLVDPDTFANAVNVTKEKVRPHVIRTEKRNAIDEQGKPLFKPRTTELFTVFWGEDAKNQKLLYEEVTKYVGKGFNIPGGGDNLIAYLLVLMQRMVTSSTRAIRTMLEKRLEALLASAEQRQQTALDIDEDWSEMDGQEQADALATTRIPPLERETERIKKLLNLAIQTESGGPDTKTMALLDWIYKLQQEESNPNLKVLIFTEFVATQAMLYDFLTARGFSAVILNGSMDLEEREIAQNVFAEKARILISTDAGGEGLNLQFCHIAINYDMPWNPMKLEQRIGRVDRIGQEHTVRALNFMVHGTIEYRVREVLEEKLALILKEFGVDKTSDVLDSAQFGQMFDSLYMDVILNPEILDSKVDAVVSQIKEEMEEARDLKSILGASTDLDPADAQRLRNHPLPQWVEKMTTSYLRSHNGSAERKRHAWQIEWPNETKRSNVVFTLRDAENNRTAKHLTLEDARVRALAMRLPRFTIGQPIPTIRMRSMPSGVSGIWSLWQICLRASDWNRSRVLPIFIHDDGRVLMPTAQSIWDGLLAEDFEIDGKISEDAELHYESCEIVAKDVGESAYNELVQEHKARLIRERDGKSYAFSRRRETINKNASEDNRNRRLSELAREENEAMRQLDEKAEISPEMFALLVARVSQGAQP